jgi:hypothetical protein
MNYFYKIFTDAIIDGSYQSQFSFLVLLLLWLLVRFDYRRTCGLESLTLMRKIAEDIFCFDRKSLSLFVSLIQRFKLRKPYLIFSSLRTFDSYFKCIFRIIDKKKVFFSQKPYVLYAYGFFRDKWFNFKSKYHKDSDRRLFFRYHSVENIMYVSSRDSVSCEALLLNISCGGARLFVKSPLRKGQRIKLFLDAQSLNSVTAKVLDVVKKADFNVVRTKFLFAYKPVM